MIASTHRSTSFQDFANKCPCILWAPSGINCRCWELLSSFAKRYPAASTAASNFSCFCSSIISIFSVSSSIISPAVLRITSIDAFNSLISFPLLQPAIYGKLYSDVSSSKAEHTQYATDSASTSFVSRSFSMPWLSMISLSCNLACAVSWIAVFKVWLWLISFLITISLSRL